MPCSLQKYMGLGSPLPAGEAVRNSAHDPVAGSLDGSGLCVNLGSTSEGSTPYLPPVSCKPFS